ncbi:NAD-dependent epimerase/dehydratase family protein [Vibrio alginolyticus]|uniref:NAD-dependent epimerase/dehydratase family protein n=1 Tax=Vibrio sp. B1FLJ16 TaxID=2751178 RepID=UPI0015F4DCE9|nr:NAD-dependent epimerase/dehydratase family protein [Vibrio sp. B1FLJ16]CAD7797693.1 NAD dependent epimerase/dehydratase family [Vibrio sp. B1FLJ16]CAE6880711.1 NAD dependent epimerase/dehydratase family [Vibrio sp. B1FLJ16]
MKVLILGGTGAMGKHLSSLLVGRGFNVTVTSRRHHNTNSSNLRFVTGNAKESRFLAQLLQERWDTIVDFMLYSTAEFEERCDSLLASTKQYVYISSSRVYADKDNIITEQSPRLLDVVQDNEYLLSDEYALSKARQENVLFGSSFSNWTIIRPYITYSEQRLQLGALEKESWLYRAIHGRPIALSSDVNDKLTTLTYGLDVAKGIAAIINQPKALGEAFHITSPYSIKWSKVFEIYIGVLSEYLGTEPKVYFQQLNEFSKHHVNIRQLEYDRLYNREFDNSKINEFLSCNEFLTPEKGLDKCLRDFIQEPTFKSINWKAEAVRDKQVGSFANLGEMPSVRTKVGYIYRRIIKLL